MVFTMASVGLPGTSGFVGEFLALVGAYGINSFVAAVATTGIILGAAYMLYLYWRMAYGVARTAEAAAMPDLSDRKSTRLNSSHTVISYAVFCLKKKTRTKYRRRQPRMKRQSNS